MKPIYPGIEKVRSILDGRSTEIRKIVRFAKRQNPHWTGYVPDGAVLYGSNNIPAAKAHCRPGDILYVRETFRLIDFDYIDGDWSATIQYKADNVVGKRLHYLRNGIYERIGWRPSIHMPREAARIFLRVNDVRAEHLKNMTGESAMDEGFSDWEDVKRICNSTVKPADLPLYGWDANPWVWVIKFERISREEAIKSERG